MSNELNSPAPAETSAPALIAIEIAYAEADRQWLLPLKIKPGCTALAAIEQSGLFDRVPALRDQPLDLGVFAKPVAADYIVQAMDRIEIYRPLRADPKQSRRARAAKKKGPGKK